MQRMLEHAERFATEIVVDHIEQADLSVASVCAQQR